MNIHNLSNSIKQLTKISCIYFTLVNLFFCNFYQYLLLFSVSEMQKTLLILYSSLASALADESKCTYIKSKLPHREFILHSLINFSVTYQYLLLLLFSISEMQKMLLILYSSLASALADESKCTYIKTKLPHRVLYRVW